MTIIKNVQILLFCAFVMATLYFVSCDRLPQSADVETIWFKNDTKDFCLYKEKSWWIYENDSGMEDSVHCIKSSLNVQGSDRVANAKSELFSFSISSSYYQRTLPIFTEPCSFKTEYAIDHVFTYHSDFNNVSIPLYFDPVDTHTSICEPSKIKTKYLGELDKFENWSNVRVLETPNVGVGFNATQFYS